jgi:hypothetical protein
MKLDIIKELVDSLHDDDFELSISNLIVDYSNIEAEISIYPLMLMRLGIYKAEKEYELSKEEKNLEYLYHDLSKKYRVKKMMLPNTSGILGLSCPKDNYQVQNLVLTDSEYIDAIHLVEELKFKVSVIRSYYNSFIKKHEIYKRKTD